MLPFQLTHLASTGLKAKANTEEKKQSTDKSGREGVCRFHKIVATVIQFTTAAFQTGIELMQTYSQ